MPLDGVREDPGGAEGFEHGGWTRPDRSDEIGWVEQGTVRWRRPPAGQRLFDGIDTTHLKLVNTTRFRSGIVLVYVPKERPRESRASATKE